ncbi:MAG: efflux RND transporter periplasmic adaptor subunit, partial [Patescibacteria group bacterium]
MRKKIIIIALGLLIALVFFRKPGVKVETFKVGRGEIVETFFAPGKIDAEERADLTFLTSGRVVWVGVKKGDLVKKWQGIASLDTVALNAAYQQALNTYRSLEAAAQKAEDDVKDHAADETFAQKATRMAAQVARDNAFDSVKAAEQALKLATIIAPFDGIITQANPAFAGVNIFPTSAVYSVVNPKSLFFNTEVNELDVTKIKVGQKVKLALDAYPDRELEGKVETIDF